MAAAETFSSPKSHSLPILWFPSFHCSCSSPSFICNNSWYCHIFPAPSQHHFFFYIIWTLELLFSVAYSFPSFTLLLSLTQPQNSASCVVSAALSAGSDKRNWAEHCWRQPQYLIECCTTNSGSQPVLGLPLCLLIFKCCPLIFFTSNS